MARRSRRPNLLKVDYDKGPNARVSSESILAEAKKLQAQPDAGVFYVKEGDAAGSLAKAAKVIEAEYTTEINIHCPMEPMNATAEIKDGILHLYSGNQFMDPFDGDRRRRGRHGPQARGHPSGVDRRRLRPPARLRHVRARGGRRQGDGHAGQGDLPPRDTTCRWISPGR